MSRNVTTHLTASAQCVPVHCRDDGLPDQGDVAPPAQEVLFVIVLEFSVLHLLDISASSKGLIKQR